MNFHRVNSVGEPAHGCLLQLRRCGLADSLQLGFVSRGIAQVNLLLNRASPWLDIDSYLPYEGKVVIHNKKARQIQVRIPDWVDKNAVQCSLSGKAVPAQWLGNYLLFESTSPSDTLLIEFPVADYTQTFHFMEATYQCRFRGNTLVWGTKTGRGAWDPPQRAAYWKDTAPMRTVTRYVAPVLIQW